MRFTKQDILSLKPSEPKGSENMDKQTRNTFHLSPGEKFTKEEIEFIKNLLSNKDFHFCCTYNGVMVDEPEKDYQ